MHLRLQKTEFLSQIKMTLFNNLFLQFFTFKDFFFYIWASPAHTILCRFYMVYNLFTDWIDSVLWLLHHFHVLQILCDCIYCRCDQPLMKFLVVYSYAYFFKVEPRKVIEILSPDDLLFKWINDNLLGRVYLIFQRDAFFSKFVLRLERSWVIISKFAFFLRKKMLSQRVCVGGR